MSVQNMGSSALVTVPVNLNVLQELARTDVARRCLAFQDLTLPTLPTSVVYHETTRPDSPVESSFFISQRQCRPSLLYRRLDLIRLPQPPAYLNPQRHRRRPLRSLCAQF